MAGDDLADALLAGVGLTNTTKEVLIPAADAAGECYHAVGGCGGHLVIRVEATAATLIDNRDLRPCQARGCTAADIPLLERCDGCGLPVFEPEEFNGAACCTECAMYLHIHQSEQDHEQYTLRETTSGPNISSPFYLQSIRWI
ncbi:hypothetical protein [Natronomonas sp. LN261]|uniref:hypothetical protein n=1 Tax=Natronomonas sp. LN261 TaxID=2750669 RepID=UPI0015EE90CD|nr:hypothetical protein [Natronomonas sp. LN261]